MSFIDRFNGNSARSVLSGFYRNFYSLTPGHRQKLAKKADADHSGKREMDSAFLVNISSVTSRVGFSYAPTGWHPFVETLREYIRDNELRYEDSTLARLYDRYCPENLQEVLLDHIKEPLNPFCYWPPVNDLIRSVWELNEHSSRLHLQGLKKLDYNTGWIFFGPHNREYGQKEFKRLISVYESIKEKGYQSQLSDTDPVDGYFLTKGADRRFVLLQGNHRVSALSVLGYPEIRVVIRKGHHSVVDHAQLYKWSKGGGGIYSSMVTEELFNALFYTTGREKAGRLGLLNG